MKRDPVMVCRVCGKPIGKDNPMRFGSMQFADGLRTQWAYGACCFGPVTVEALERELFGPS